MKRYPELPQADDSDRTREQLIRAAQEVWDDLADGLLATLSDTVSNRRDEAKGWCTKY
jgi:hypothetical protein